MPPSSRSVPPLALLAFSLGCHTEPAAPPGPGFVVLTPKATPDEPTPDTRAAPQVTPVPLEPFAVNAAAHFQREHVCDGTECKLTGWLPDPSFRTTPLEGVASRVAIWVERMTPHARLDVPRHTGLRFVVFMLAGKATYAAHEASKSEALEPFDALTTAGTDFHLECSEESCQAFFAAIALRGSLADTLDQAGVSTGVSDDTFRKRTLSEIAPHALPGGAGSASIVFGGNDPDTSFSLTLLRARAGHSIPIHRHERSWENLLLLNGKGELSLRGRPYPLEGGETVHVPPDVRHGFFAAGTEPMSALTLYVPAGPERRFMK